MTIINYLLNNLDQLIMIDQNIPFFKKGIDYYVNKPTKTAQFFFIGKTIINYSLPNQGNVLSYLLSDNILKFIYNYSLKTKNDYPFILRHNFKIFNNYYNINFTKNNLIKDKINPNNEIAKKDINNEHNYMVSYEYMQGELNNCDNFVSNIENSTISSSSSINNDISLTVITSSSSSSNDPLISINIDNNSNIAEKLIIFRDLKDGIVEVILRDNKIIKVEVNKTRINLPNNYPIIDNEKLKLCFVNGYGTDIEKKIFFFICFINCIMK